VALSTNRGMPVLLDAKKDPAAKGLSQLVDRLGPAAAGKEQRSAHRRVVV
jgi:pilus assembly protein CpaE